VRLETHQAATLPVREVVAQINQWTCRDATNNMFATMFFGIYDPAEHTLTYTNAGHCFPIVFHADGTCEVLETGGCFLGIMEQIEYEDATIKVLPGDTIVIYTDGVTDAHNSQRQVFGGERLIETVKQNLDLPAQEMRDEIYESTLVFSGNAEQFDDMTIMIVKFEAANLEDSTTGKHTPVSDELVKA